MMPASQPQISRPQFLAGLGAGGAAVLAACGGTSEEPATSPGATLAATSDVPVGSGIVVDDTVLTQPVAGEFKGFSNVCTHTGCRLNDVADGLILCPCHGSRFHLDGTVEQGPAARPLDTKAIVVEGESILAG